MNYFFTLHSFLEVGKTQDLPSKFWQTLGDALITIFFLLARALHADNQIGGARALDRLRE
jgi:hypothetical protein